MVESNSFTKLYLKTGVKSSKGFLVQLTGRRELQYEEGDRILIIEVERKKDKRGSYLAVYMQNLKYWAPPYDREILTAEEKNEIIQNIIDAFIFMGIGHVIYK